MFVIECSHSTDIGTVCFLSALTPIEISKNVRQLDFVATDQVVLLNGVGNLTLLLQIVGGLAMSFFANHGYDTEGFTINPYMVVNKVFSSYYKHVQFPIVTFDELKREIQL